MSWNHQDYINLASSLGTVIAALMALIAAKNSMNSSKNSRLMRERDEESKCFDKLLSVTKSISEIYSGKSIRILNEGDRESLIRLICLAHILIVEYCKDQAAYKQKDNFLLLMHPDICKSIYDQRDGFKTNNNLDFMTGDWELLHRYRLAREFFKDTTAH